MYSYVEKILLFLSGHDFLVSFFSSILAGVPFAILVPLYLRWLKRPRLDLFFFSNFKVSKEFVFNKSNNVRTGKFGLVIKNKSAASLEKIYIHILIPEIIEPQLNNNHPTYVNNLTLVPYQNAHYKIQGYLDEPIYPYRPYIMPVYISFKLDPKKLAGVDEINILYYFSTELGVSPKNAVSSGSDNVEGENLGVIKIKLT